MLQLLIIIRQKSLTKECIQPVHPGAYLKELLNELEISQYRLAHDLGIGAMRLSYVINGKRPVNAELAMRLGRYFGQDPRYWVNLQARYDLDLAGDALCEQIFNEVRPLKIAG